MHSKPIVSVVIPIYNNAEYLEQGLDSIVRQTLKNIEILCVDDGSTDASPDILASYSAKDPRIRVLHTEHRGAGAARNIGIQNAEGTYLYFFDSDDYCSKQLLDITVKTANRENADIVAFHFDRVDTQGNHTFRNGFHRKWLPKKTNTFCYTDCPDKIMSIVNPTPWNKLYRREFVVQNNLKFEEISSSNDITFAAVSAAYAKRIALIDKTLYHYRIGHAHTISSGKYKNLNNVISAVESAVRQASALPYIQTIQNAVRYFEIDNYVFALQNYVPDFGHSSAEPFYTALHQRFSRSDYSAVTEHTLQNKKLYHAFRIIRANEYQVLKENLNRKLIVSLTTYPARINSIHHVLQTIYDQTYPADQVVLWLAEEQFPHRDQDLPKHLCNLVSANKLKVCWCSDLKPHKKYFYALQEYSEDLVVTIDDDLLYHPNLLWNLYVSYLEHPHAVSAARAHLITGSSDSGILSYNYWIKELDLYIGEPSMQLLCTGGAGSLYPPHIFNPELFDEQAIRNTCLFADDLWLKAMEILSNVPVVVCESYAGLHYIPGSQDDALCKSNINDNQNDVQLNKIIAWIDQKYGKDTLQNKLFHSDIGRNLIGLETLCICYSYERSVKNELIRSLRKQLSLSASMANGSKGILSWLKRKITGGIRCYREHGMKYTLKRIQSKIKAKLRKLSLQRNAKLSAK